MTSSRPLLLGTGEPVGSPFKRSAICGPLHGLPYWRLSPLRVRGLDPVRLHGDLRILAKLPVEVAVWRRVQQTNSGRIPLDAFRVALSGLAPLV
jgi:hypothetical protein